MDTGVNAPRRLGWIKPDDNVRPDHDCYHLEEWLDARGIANVRTVVATSRSSGIHTRRELIETGDLDRLVPAAKELVGAGCEVVVWACTSGSFIGGLNWSRRQAAGLQETTGRFATSTTLALIAAAEAMGAKTVDLLGTYPEEVTAALAGVFAEAGLSVAHRVALGMPQGKATFELNLCKEAERLRGSAYSKEHPVVIPDTAANSLELIERLEEILGRPVITANQASLWHGLVLLGVKAVCPNAGFLFKGERLA